MHTIAFVGARGGHGTTTVAAVAALHLARTSPAVLVSEPDAAGALLGIGPVVDEGRPLPVTGSLSLAPRHPGAGLVVVDEGTLADLRRSVDTPAPAERYLVLRGPCYVALTTALVAAEAIDGIILVEEPQRSLTAADVTDVLGIPVAATVTVSPQVARTLDSGLLPDRFSRLRDLASLRTIGTCTAAPARPGRPTPRQHTDLPLTPCVNGRGARIPRIASRFRSRNPR